MSPESLGVSVQGREVTDGSTVSGRSRKKVQALWTGQSKGDRDLTGVVLVEPGRTSGQE